MGSESHIKSDIPDAEGDPGDPEVTDAIHHGPVRVISAKGGFRLFFMEEVVHINILCLHGHVPYVFKEMRGMGILFRVAIGMMHAVEDRVSPRVQERRTLTEKSEPVKELFPEFIHFKHLMRCIPV